MKSITAMGAALATTLFFASPALALGNANATLSNQGEKFPVEFGRARPPIGYVRFCATFKQECKPHGKKGERLAMTQERWNTLYQINTFINGKITPVSDQELYGEPERWTYPVDSGDCEDYLLLKKQYLEKLGFPPEALLITVVLDEHSEGHAVLTVATTEGDFILDNRRNDIRAWRDTNYTFLKRQSQQDPRFWIALVKEKTVTTGVVSSGMKR